ncbi:HAD hydrolase family protein, partial [uncultured Corynebacterium sp.]|uniref:HAD hydrolase family protein n=1 Tax=uncultured Corynebacterium sp. TaxID=159447 RepID=UPI0025D71F04
MGKILFVDIGGTLIDYSNWLPYSAVAAIRAARANGHKVYLSTGRSIAEVSQELWNIGVDGLIGAQGAYVESHQQVVYHRGLSGEETRKVVDWLKARG